MPELPPMTLEERLKTTLIPASLYIRYRAAKEKRSGEAEIHILGWLADSARISLDIGANKGVYAWMLRNVSRQVIGFEPHPTMFRYLQRLESKNIRALPYALSNENGYATLSAPKTRRGFTTQGASLRADKATADALSMRVETRRLDDLDIAPVGFMKIDVEGFEQEVLDGASETLKRDRPTLLIELEETHTHQPIEASIEQVEKRGYRAHFLRGGVLQSIERFDPISHHREAKGRPGYVYNFIFLPT